MKDTLYYYDIGGLKLQYSESAENKIGCGFIRSLQEFSSNNSLYTDISIENQINTYMVSLITAYSDLPVYEKRNGVFTYSIFKQTTDRYIWVTWIKPRSVFLAYSIDSMWRNACLLADYTDSNGVEMFDDLADVFSYSALALGGIVFHGVVMEYQDRGVILSAPSGTGKTTHSNIWRDLELSIIINGDRALCRFINGSWTVFGMPWCGSSGISQNRQVPIQAIVILEQHSENIVERLNPLEALKRLLPNVYAPAWEPALYNKMLDRLDEIIPAVPIFLLRCRPDIDAALTLKSALDSL